MVKKIILSLAAFLYLTSLAISAEGDSLQGTWVLESLEEKGGKKDDGIKGVSLVFSGDTFRFGTADLENTGSYKTDTDKKPNQIDMTQKILGDDITTLAIFKIEGDTLTISSGTTTPSTMRDDGTIDEVVTQGPRPTAFTSKLGVLMVLKRIKK